MRNRSWGVALERARGDRRAAAVALLRTSAEVHEEWRAYAASSGDHSSGTPGFHAECIEAYEQIIETIEGAELDAHAASMRWTCEVGGHPRQKPDDGACVCRTHAHHVEAGAVEIECAPTETTPWS